MALSQWTLTSQDTVTVGEDLRGWLSAQRVTDEIQLVLLNCLSDAPQATGSKDQCFVLIY